MDILLSKKVRKRQLTGASIRDCFNTDGVFGMWRSLHSNQGIIFKKLGGNSALIPGSCQTPEKKKELRAVDSMSKIQRSQTKNTANRQLTKSQERGPKSSLLLFRDEPMTHI